MANTLGEMKLTGEYRCSSVVHACVCCLFTKWTPISTDSSGKRIDDKIHIHLLLDTSASVHNLTQGSVNVQLYTLCAYCTCMCSVDGTSLILAMSNPQAHAELFIVAPLQCASCNSESWEWA